LAAAATGEIERRLAAYGDDAGLVVVIRTGMTAALHFHVKLARVGLGGHRSPDTVDHVIPGPSSTATIKSHTGLTPGGLWAFLSVQNRNSIHLRSGFI
jgi:hypothetical protein